MKKFKNLMKRGLATFLSLILAVGTMSITAFADTADDAENASNTTYEVEEITHNGVPVEGAAFDAMKASLEGELNGDSQEDDDSKKPAGEDVNSGNPGEDDDSKKPEEPSQSTKLPVEVWVELLNHANDNLTTADDEMPKIEVTYSYELNGETVTGSYVCGGENGSWKFDEEKLRWEFRHEIDIPEGVTSVKFTQSNYDIDGYIINSDENHKDVIESEYVFGSSTAHPGFYNAYCLKSHADVSVEIGGVKDENGETKDITKDEDGKLIVDYKPGDIIEYKVTVTNDGVDDVNHMLLTVTFPEGLELVYWEQLPDGTWSCTPPTVEGFHEDGTKNEGFKGVYDYNKTPEEQGVENYNYDGFAWLNYVISADWIYAQGTKGEMTVSAGTYVLQIGSGYGTDPLSELGSSVTVTLLARVISEIASGDLELKAEGTTIIGIKDDATVTVYAPKAPEEPPVIVITPTPTPNPDPVPDPDPEEPVDIEDPETPLAEQPEEPVEIDEPEVPLEELPEIIDIDDPDVPLSDVPQTGDISFLWYGAVVVSVMGLVGLSLLERKKRQEN